jgi:hypothetical protein
MTVLADDRVAEHRAAKLNIVIRKDVSDVDLVLNHVVNNAARQLRRRQLWWRRWRLGWGRW